MKLSWIPAGVARTLTRAGAQRVLAEPSLNSRTSKPHAWLSWGRGSRTWTCPLPWRRFGVRRHAHPRRVPKMDLLLCMRSASVLGTICQEGEQRCDGLSWRVLHGCSRVPASADLYASIRCAMPNATESAFRLRPVFCGKRRADGLLALRWASMRSWSAALYSSQCSRVQVHVHAFRRADCAH